MSDKRSHGMLCIEKQEKIEGDADDIVLTRERNSAEKTPQINKYLTAQF